ncbi:MAG: hypothetical protein PHW04_04740 [Candidatus Wallbacteria bacterium]|nr:hypothetical protein [Candidatus Wallbacteria bacterium]
MPEIFLYMIMALLVMLLVAISIKNKQNLARIEEQLLKITTENTKIKNALSSLDEVDEINQIYTFKYFHHLVEREIERAERYNTKFSLLFIEALGLKDMDSASQVSIFRNIMDIIKSNIRLVDICFQNEITYTYVLVLMETEPGQAKKIASRIYSSILKLSPNVQNLVNMGVVSYPVDGTLRRNLIEKSKICLEEASKLKDQRITVYSEISGME